MDSNNAFEALGIDPRNGKLTSEQINKVKGLGCLRDKRFDDIFNVRVITRNGKITTDEQRAIAKAADLYGSHEVAMTSRQTVEIQGVSYDNIPSLILYLRENGLECGGTGPKVRPIVSCKGTTCQYGLIDTFALSERIHNVFYTGYHSVVLPHKFKIAVGGCPNNCVKPELNDIGIIGQRIFEVNEENCRGCSTCVVEASCPMKAARLKNGRIGISAEICNNCGRCFGKCPFGAIENAREGYKVSLGGRWGKKTAVARPLSRILTSEDEVIAVIEKAILLFKNEGIKGERFADTIERLGFEYVEGKLLEN
ncbi:MAG: 4Fe-4S binding protein [Clostridia bacterium]|nr:4Fe-4S binding protein [Clostridia bacterium]